MRPRATRRRCMRCREVRHIPSGEFCGDCEKQLAEKARAETPLRVLSLDPSLGEPLRSLVVRSAVLTGLGGRIGQC